MSDFEKLIKRFSACAYLKDCQRGAGTTLIIGSNHTLKSLMEHLIETDPDADEDDWARFFLKGLMEGKKNYQTLFIGKADISTICIYIVYLKLCNDFLFSYLQISCWEAAKRVSDYLKFSSNTYLHYSLEDCFIIASEFALKPASLLRKFDLKLGLSIGAYAQPALLRIIRNEIARELKTKSVKFSDNGLLRNLSKPKLEKALLAYGIQIKIIEKYCLAWHCFKDLFEAIYPATSSDGSRSNNPRTTPLNDRQLSQIAARYNQMLQRLAINSKPVEGQEIKQMLTICTQAARAFQNQRLVPLEARGEAAFATPSSLEDMIEEETRDELVQVKNIISKEFQKLDRVAQTSLMLWLGLEINQSDFLSLLNLKKQYQVARLFQGYQKNILKAVIQLYLQNNTAKSLTEREINQVCKDKLNSIKDCLVIYSKNFFEKLLKIVLDKEIEREEKLLLIQCFDSNPQKKKNENILDSSNIPLQAQACIQKIQGKFASTIEKELKIQLTNFSSAQESIAKFIEQWLQKNWAVVYQGK